MIALVYKYGKNVHQQNVFVGNEKKTTYWWEYETSFNI